MNFTLNECYHDKNKHKREVSQIFWHFPGEEKESCKRTPGREDTCPCSQRRAAPLCLPDKQAPKTSATGDRLWCHAMRIPTWGCVGCRACSRCTQGSQWVREPGTEGEREGKRAGGARQQQQPEREWPTPHPSPEDLTWFKLTTSVLGGQALHSKLEILLEQQSSNCLISKLRLLSPWTEMQILSSSHTIVSSTKVSKSKTYPGFFHQVSFLVLLDKGSYLHYPLRQENGRK